MVGVEVSGLIDNKEGTLDFSAPLPTFGLRMDIALIPKWFFRSGTQIFYLEYQDFKGSVLATHGAVEYTPWDHICFGLGVDSFRLKDEAEGEDYPSMNFRGNVESTMLALSSMHEFSFKPQLHCIISESDATCVHDSDISIASTAENETPQALTENLNL